MDTNNELKTHIVYEFFSGLPNRDTILNEERGVAPGLDKVVRAICRDMVEQAEETKETQAGTYRRTYRGKLSDKGMNSFFDDYCIEITMLWKPYGDIEYRGGFYPGQSLQDTSDGLTCSPYIMLTIGGSSVNELMYIARFAIGHELTHAYNNLMYGRNNGLTKNQVIDQFLYKQGYSAMQKTINNATYDNEKAMAKVLYLLNRMERNAYIAQLRHEMEDKANDLEDSESAWQAVLHSESYKKFKDIERNMDIILNGSITDPVKLMLIATTNKITGKKFKNFGQLQKYYRRYWYVWKKKYLTMAAKIVHDVYDEYHPLIDGIDPGDEVIEP